MKLKIFSAVIVIVAAIIGYHFYKVHSLRQQLETVAVRDNILIAEVLEVEENSPNITFVEYLEKMAKNRTERDELKRKVELIEPYGNKEMLVQYAQLFDSENEYVRAEEARLRQIMKYSADKKDLEAATQRGEEAVRRIKAGQASFMSESWLERDMAKKSQHTLDLVDEGEVQWNFEKSSNEDLRASATGLTEAVASSMKAADALERDEQTHYPDFLPNRNLKKQFQQKKVVYQSIQASVKSTRERLHLEQ